MPSLVAKTVPETRSAERAIRDGVPDRTAASSRFRSDTAGATSIEYALIAGLVFLTIVGALRTYAASMTDMYGVIEAAVTKK